MFIDLKNSSIELKKEAAKILFTSSKSITTSWNTLELAEEEIFDSCKENYFLIGFIEENELLGFVGLRPMYEPSTWELHPLMVLPKSQKKKIGTKLLQEMERIAKEKKIHTIILGTDDELNQTSLSTVDLFTANLLEEIKNIKNLKNHPFEFYQKNGYQIVGVIPDANGKFKPDILMGKRIF